MAFAWIETTDGDRFDGPIKQDRFPGYDTDVWFKLPDGTMIPKYVVRRLGPNRKDGQE